MRRNLPGSPRALSTKLNELVYRGEGNNTIVLSDDRHGMIYRFRKTSFSGDQEEPPNHRKKYKAPKCLNESFNFRHNVMRGFLGDEFVTAMEILEVPSEVLQRLDKRLEPDRPDFRLTKSIDVSYRNVLRAPDACMMPQRLLPYGVGPTVCVEVKPKKGFIHLTKGLNERSCKFCMVQYHPKKTKMWPRRSSYCPCDLFSGERPRMRRALHSLLSNPQINFRSFLNSRPQYTCNFELEPYLQFLCTFLDVKTTKQSAEELVELLIDGLLYSFRSKEVRRPPRLSQVVPHTLHCGEGSRKAQEEGKMVISDGDTNTHSTLPPDCILGRIFELQLRDTLGVRGIHPYLQIVRDHLEKNKDSWQWNTPQRVASCVCEKDLGLREAFRLVEDYLVASVAYDCSLMITLQKAKPNIPSSLPTLKTRSGQHFLLNVVVVDLDPKSFSKVANTALSWDEEISAAYRANRARPDQCEDLSRSSSSCSSSSPSRLTSTSSSPAPPSPKSCRLSRPL